MPALYAHNRFGQKVLEQLKGELKDIVTAHDTQFKIGLQGPDIFFFYTRKISFDYIMRFPHILFLKGR